MPEVITMNLFESISLIPRTRWLISRVWKKKYSAAIFLLGLVKREVKETFQGPVCKILRVASLTAGFICRPLSGFHTEWQYMMTYDWESSLIALNMILYILELFSE